MPLRYLNTIYMIPNYRTLILTCIHLQVKRAPSPYIIFCNENRDKIKSANPTATFGQLGKLCGEAWRKLNLAGKKVNRICISIIYHHLNVLTLFFYTFPFSHMLINLKRKRRNLTFLIY